MSKKSLNRLQIRSGSAPALDSWLDLDSFLGSCFCLELGGVGEWTSGGVVSMVDVTAGFEGVPGLLTCL